MGNQLSSRRSPKGKTLEHELPSRDRHTLPVHKVKTTGTRLLEPPPKPLECPDFMKGGFEQDWDKLKDINLKKKVIEYRDAIQPHTDEGGDAYYIGDAYEAINRIHSAAWRVDQ